MNKNMQDFLDKFPLGPIINLLKKSSFPGRNQGIPHGKRKRSFHLWDDNDTHFFQQKMVFVIKKKALELDVLLFCNKKTHLH